MRLKAWLISLIALGSAASLCCVASEPPSEQWKWVRLERNTAQRRPHGPWIILQGEAKVDLLGGGRFRLELRHREGIYSDNYVIDGRIAGTQVSAQEIKQNTDAPPVEYRGTLTDMVFRDGSKQTWISLTSPFGEHLSLRSP
jgi:hypothetical protein